MPPCFLLALAQFRLLLFGLICHVRRGSHFILSQRPSTCLYAAYENILLSCSDLRHFSVYSCVRVWTFLHSTGCPACAWMVGSLGGSAA